MKIAIVHDFLNQFGGAERVVSAFNEIWPEAPIFTSIYDETKMPANFQKMDIRVSFMQKLPLIMKFFKLYFYFYPIAFEKFDLSEYDVILSSSSAFAKGIRKRPDQLHVCYCYTPMRFVWRSEDYFKRERVPGFVKWFLPFLLEPLKRWDIQNSTGVDYFLTSSKTVAERIKKTYKCQSDIINPPVEAGFFKPINLDGDYFLVVSRLNTYKRIDLVVRVFTQLDLPLKIIGSGPDLNNLKGIAGPNIEFLGYLTDQEIAQHLAACRALIFPGEEDFGIVPIEAMACGRPVIAYRAGGAKETVLDEETGIFFDEQSEVALMKAVQRFQFMTFDKERIRRHAERFDKENFKQKIKDYVEKRQGMKA
ncbi:MAG: glycosyltransferase [bacterium]